MAPPAAPGGDGSPQVLYFEAQRAALCGVHALNTLLQGPVFSEWDLAAVGQRLDETEAALMSEMGTGTAEFAAWRKEASGNVALDGNFSIQVLEKALSVFGLSCVPLSSKCAEAAAARAHPERETGFLLNLELHWFTLRKLGRDWWRFNSLDAAPQPVSETYLSVLLVQLQTEGWSVFVVRGDWAQRNALLGSTSPNGRWFTPAEAAEAVAQAQREKVAGRTRSAANDALARAGAQGVLTLRPRRDAHDDGDDEDLRRAMAASLGEAHPPPWPPQGGSAPAADEDAMLARAIAASLEDENPASRRRLNSPPQKAEQPAVVLDEPASDAAGALTLAFRLPGGSRLTRRFLPSDALAAVAATLQSLSGCPMSAHRMTHGHPPTALEDWAQTLEEAQLPDRTVVKGTGPGSFTHAFRNGLVACDAHVQAYGACLRAALPAVNKGACDAEFAALRTCFFAAVKQARRGAAPAGMTTEGQLLTAATWGGGHNVGLLLPTSCSAPGRRLPRPVVKAAG